MGRSVSIRKSKSKASISTTNTARRRASGSDSSTSSSSGSAQFKSSHDGVDNSDAPFRNLRRRTSGREYTKSPAAFQSGAQGRKRPNVAAKSPPTSFSSSFASSPTVANRSSKRRKGKLTVSVDELDAKGMVVPTTRARARARSQSQQLAVHQVTPSPVPTLGKSFFSKSPLKTKKTLPEGVIDLYPDQPLINNRHEPSCDCNQDVCCSKALSKEYIRVYGQDFCRYMKEHERPIIASPPPDRSRESSQKSKHGSTSAAEESKLQSPSADSESSSAGSSCDSPDQRRIIWSYVDTSHLTPLKAVETSQFLEYQPDLSPKMRAILMDWIIELSDHFHFGHSTLHLACTLVDQVLACGALSLNDGIETEDEPENEFGYEQENDVESKTNCFLISRDRFQLLGATCTWLACKLEEQSPPKVAQIAYVSDNIYSVEQIKRMERRVCNALSFALARQTPYPFLHEFLRASTECADHGCESPQVFRNLVLYLMELGRLPYLPITCKPSLLTAAAIYLARATLGMNPWSPSLTYYTGYTKEDLREVALSIHRYHSAAEESSLKSCFAKYKQKKYSKVALKTVPRLEDLRF